MKLYYQSERVTVHHGDCLDVLRELPDASVDAVATDPPYGLEFMGKDWDKFGAAKARIGRGGQHPNRKGDMPNLPQTYLAGTAFQAWCEQWAAECLRVLKPGGHMLAFGGTRTWHRLACAIEDAGFEIRDNLAYMYGAGFPKAWNFSTQYRGDWCRCEGANALPYNHASDPDLPGVRDRVPTPEVTRSKSQEADVQPHMQRQDTGGRLGEARAQGPGGMVPGNRAPRGRVDARREEPGVEGWHLPRAGQGLPDGTDAGSPASESEWLRGGAPVGDGVNDRQAGRTTGGSAPHQRQPSGQPAGESAAVPGPHESLDDRALRVGPVCARCGGLDARYKGFSTSLKPAYEPIVLARKPLAGTVAGNVLAHGTGALNVDGCRVEGDGGGTRCTNRDDSGFCRGHRNAGRSTAGETFHGPDSSPAGRWPANVVLDEAAAATLDKQSGERTSGLMRAGITPKGERNTYGKDAAGGYTREADTYGDSGGASRFFYTAKAGSDERPRDGTTAHPTVKPLDLMRWLVRLVTPPGGTVLEPFAGSGTTVEACLLEGFRCVAVEREADYLPLILQRIHRRVDPVAHHAATRADDDEPSLFDLLGGDAAWHESA